MGTKHIYVEDLEKEFGPLTFGGLLNAYRLGEEITQVAMAKKLGLSKQHLNDMEKGRRLPSLRKAVIIAKKISHLEELIVQLVLQDQLRREKLKYTVSIDSSPSRRKAS